MTPENTVKTFLEGAIAFTIKYNKKRNGKFVPTKSFVESELKNLEIFVKEDAMQYFEEICEALKISK